MRRALPVRFALVALVLVAATTGCRKSNRGTIKVAAASDLAKAFEELGREFKKTSGIRPVFTFGSSGLLARQIGEGAPFDVFAAANIGYVDEVIGKGACEAATRRPYARGRIVVWTPSVAIKTLADLADPRWKKIAIANPDHAPYGKAAKEALIKAGIWDQLEREKRLVYGENVRQGLQWAQEGSADATIVAMSLTLVTDGGKSLAIDEAMHQPLIQALAVCGKGPGAAGGKQFVDFLASPTGQEIMKRYGFVLPG